MVLLSTARRSLVSTGNTRARTCTERCDVPEADRLLLEELVAPTRALPGELLLETDVAVVFLHPVAR